MIQVDVNFSSIIRSPLRWPCIVETCRRKNLLTSIHIGNNLRAVLRVDCSVVTGCVAVLGKRAVAWDWAVCCVTDWTALSTRYRREGNARLNNLLASAWKCARQAMYGTCDVTQVTFMYPLVQWKRRMERDITIIVHTSWRKVPVILVRF